MMRAWLVDRDTELISDALLDGRTSGLFCDTFIRVTASFRQVLEASCQHCKPIPVSLSLLLQWWHDFITIQNLSLASFVTSQLRRHVHPPITNCVSTLCNECLPFQAQWCQMVTLQSVQSHTGLTHHFYCDKFVTCWFHGNRCTYDLRARPGLACVVCQKFLGW